MFLLLFRSGPCQKEMGPLDLRKVSTQRKRDQLCKDLNFAHALDKIPREVFVIKRLQISCVQQTFSGSGMLQEGHSQIGRELAALFA